MAIYDFSKIDKNELKISVPQQQMSEGELALDESETAKAASFKTSERAQIFSAIAARLFFLLLLIGDVIWAGYALVRFSLALIGMLVTACKMNYFKSLREKAWISLRRSLVCGISLFIAIFNPAFGIMIACTYFLMYDKSGIEEVVPSSLQSQFKEFFPSE